MPNFPKISNPFEDETDFIDRTDPADLAKQAVHQAAKAVNQQVVKPVTQQLNTDQAIVDFLYGASDSAPNVDATGGAMDPGIEQLNQSGQLDPAQLAKLQQVADPNQQMARNAKAQLTPEQVEEREKNRLHIRNYYTTQNKLDDIGTLEEQISKVRQEKQQEEQMKLQEEEEEKQRKEQEEQEKRQQLAMPQGKKTGMQQGGKKPSMEDEMMRREQNKSENKSGFSG